MKVKIHDKYIGENEPCFIIAEAGINHNGNIITAKQLIDAAFEVGADAIKFQTYKTEELMSKNLSNFDLIKSYELNEDEVREISNYSKDKNIIFLSTPFDKNSIDLLFELDVSAYKIASCDLTNIPLLRYIASKNKTLLLSTGMSTICEIEAALNAIRFEGNRNIILLYCVSTYPALPKEINLNRIKILKHIFKLPVGFSDHSSSIGIPIGAVALGANIIEKHITLDKNLPGPDHKASSDFQDFKDMIKGIREVEKSMGEYTGQLSQSEENMKKILRRSIVAKVDILKGTKITKKMLSIKRPGNGIQPKFLDFVVDMRPIKDIKKDQVITWGLLGRLNDNYIHY